MNPLAADQPFAGEVWLNRVPLGVPALLFTPLVVERVSARTTGMCCVYAGYLLLARCPLCGRQCCWGWRRVPHLKSFPRTPLQEGSSVQAQSPGPWRDEPILLEGLLRRWWGQVLVPPARHGRIKGCGAPVRSSVEVQGVRPVFQYRTAPAREPA